jgi:ubiquitin-protein ligase
MIEFNCPNCAKAFRVPEQFAGRTAKCKACGASLRVPAAVPVQTPTPQPVAVEPQPQPEPSLAHLPMRTRRLIADAQHMAEAFRRWPIVRILETRGDPPDLYRIEYYVQGLAPGDDPERPQERGVHRVEIQLTADYPRISPKCRMLTPVYHPNIDPSHICVGDHWTAGERLVDLVVRIGEMLAYQAYNIKSPLDAYAAMWADLNPDRLPIDPRTIRPAELE